MSDPTLNTDHVTEGLGRLLTQFKGRPNIEGVLQSYLEQVQELEVVFFALMVERYVLTAIGAQLDGIGDIVGEARGGKDDTNYRAAILGRIARNADHSRIEDLLEMFVALLPGFTFDLATVGTAAIQFTILEALGPSDPTPAVLNQQLQEAKGGGIHGSLIYSGVDADARFTFASGDALEPDAAQGFGNDAGTTGGAYSDVVA